LKFSHHFSKPKIDFFVVGIGVNINFSLLPEYDHPFSLYSLTSKSIFFIVGIGANKNFISLLLESNHSLSSLSSKKLKNKSNGVSYQNWISKMLTNWKGIIGKIEGWKWIILHKLWNNHVFYLSFSLWSLVFLFCQSLTIEFKLALNFVLK